MRACLIHYLSSAQCWLLTKIIAYLTRGRSEGLPMKTLNEDDAKEDAAAVTYSTGPRQYLCFLGSWNSNWPSIDNKCIRSSSHSRPKSRASAAINMVAAHQ